MEPRMRIAFEISEYIYRGEIVKIDEKKIIMKDVSRILEYHFSENNNYNEINIIKEEQFSGLVTFFLDKIVFVHQPSWA